MQGRAQLNARPADRDASASRLPAGTALGWLASTITQREGRRERESFVRFKFRIKFKYYFLKKLVADGSGNSPEIRRTQNQKNPEPFHFFSWGSSHFRK
jgi:hypothetical protein